MSIVWLVKLRRRRSELVTTKLPAPRMSGRIGASSITAKTLAPASVGLLFPRLSHDIASHDRAQQD
jgi:hypothetical protein